MTATTDITDERALALARLIRDHPDDAPEYFASIIKAVYERGVLIGDIWRGTCLRYTPSLAQRAVLKAWESAE